MQGKGVDSCLVTNWAVYNGTTKKCNVWMLEIRSITNVSFAVHFLIVIQVSIKAYGPFGELGVSL